MDKKKLLFVLPVARPGGAGSALASLYNCLDLNKYSIDVFPMAYSSQESKDRLPYAANILRENKLLAAFFGPIEEAEGYAKINFFMVKTATKLLMKLGFNTTRSIYKRAISNVESKKNYDIVVAFLEGATTHFTAFSACPNKIAWVHVDYNQYLPVGKSELKLYEKYKRIVTVANYTTSVFVDRYPSLKSRTMSIHNPLDVERVLEDSKAPLDDTRFIQDGLFSIISVGRIAAIKRFSSIPMVVAKIADLPFRWYIIGPDRDHEEYEKLCDNIKKYGLSEKVIILGPKLNPYPYFKAADLLVSTSRSEACPMIFNEARVLNLPIVSADYPAAFEFIENGVNGLISPFDDLHNAVKRLVTDKALYESIKQKSVFSSIDNDEIVSKFDALIANC